MQLLLISAILAIANRVLAAEYDLAAEPTSLDYAAYHPDAPQGNLVVVTASPVTVTETTREWVTAVVRLPAAEQ